MAEDEARNDRPNPGPPYQFQFQSQFQMKGNNQMLLHSQKVPGKAVTWIIGQLGEKADKWPARILEVYHGVDERGREGEVADIIVQQLNLDGEPYLRGRTVLTAFLGPRTARVEALDGTEKEPLAIEQLQEVQLDSFADYMASDRAKARASQRVTAADLPI